MLGIALVVLVFILVRALAHGSSPRTSTRATNENLIVLRKGLDRRISSQISRDEARRVKYLDGIARNGRGEPLASAEMIG